MRPYGLTTELPGDGDDAARSGLPHVDPPQPGVPPRPPPTGSPARAHRVTELPTSDARRVRLASGRHTITATLRDPRETP